MKKFVQINTQEMGMKMKLMRTSTALFALAAAAVFTATQAWATDLDSTMSVEVLSSSTVTVTENIDLGIYTIVADGLEATSVVIDPADGDVTNDAAGNSTMILIGGTAIPQLGEVTVADALATTTMNISFTPGTVTLTCENPPGTCGVADEDLQLVLSDSEAGVLTTSGGGAATFTVAGTLGPVNIGAVTADFYDEPYTGSFDVNVNY